MSVGALCVKFISVTFFIVDADSIAEHAIYRVIIMRDVQNVGDN